MICTRIATALRVAFVLALAAAGCSAPADEAEPSTTAEQGLSSALPLGPVSLHLEGFADDESGGRRIPMKIVCDLTGTNPGVIDVACTARTPYDGISFSAKGSANGDGGTARYRKDATDSRGTRRSYRGDIAIELLRKDDTLWARMSAAYEATEGFARRTFTTRLPALIVVTRGTAERTVIESEGASTPCEHACRDANLRCLEGRAQTSRRSSFVGCPSLYGEKPVSCSTRYTLSGEICAARLSCHCI